MQIVRDQISANWGPDSRFVVKAIFKPLVPKSSWSSILKTQNRAMQSTNSSSTWNYPKTNMLTQILTRVKTFLSQNKSFISNTWPLFDMVYNLEYRLISELFLNNNTRFSYLPKFVKDIKRQTDRQTDKRERRWQHLGKWHFETSLI